MLEEISLIIHARFERLALTLEPSDLKTISMGVLSHLQDLNQERERIVLHADEPLPSLMLDVRRIQYVLSNLLSNALKYSDRETSVSLDLLARNDGVLIQVTDHGIGIPPEEQQHIFEPFFRAHNVGTIGGTGLGLSIVKEIVKLHRGTIELHSEVNKGTQVSVFLPNA